jgi:hypothetical protein
MRVLDALLGCSVVAFTAVVMVVGAQSFLLAIPIVWLVGELIAPKQ